MAFLPGLIASIVGGGALPKIIETGAGLLKNLAGSVLGAEGGNIVNKLIDTGAGLAKDAIGGKAEPSAPHLSAEEMSSMYYPVGTFSERMEYPNDIASFRTTPAGRVLLPDVAEAANQRTVMIPSPFMARPTPGMRVAPHATRNEQAINEEPSRSFRVLPMDARMQRRVLSAPRPGDAPTEGETKLLEAAGVRRKPRNRHARDSQGRYKKYFS